MILFPCFSKMPHGSALYSRVQLDGGAWEVAFLLRVSDKRFSAGAEGLKGLVRLNG
jgi:hypothetical protein